MFTFVFNANRESLREFNSRVHEFCADKPVISIDATAFGPNLIIQGTLADDVDADDLPTLTAVVRVIEQGNVLLEEQLDNLIAQEAAKNNPDDEDADPNVPVRFIIAASDKHAWVVLLCVNGVAEDEDPGEGTPEPVSPSEGFKS